MSRMLPRGNALDGIGHPVRVEKEKMEGGLERGTGRDGGEGGEGKGRLVAGEKMGSEREGCD